MTEYRGRDKVRRHRSLYLGLLYNIVLGILLAVVIYFAIRIPSTYLINRYFVTPEMGASRRTEYLESLQSFVTDDGLDLENSDRIAEWVRGNPYVYLLVYYSSEDSSGQSGMNGIAPGAKDRLSELSGLRVDENLGRDEIIAEARSHGYYKIELTDGEVIVAIAEYTENLYYTVFAGISLIAAGLTFTLMLVRYIRVIIERIKRFESDVTIVSEIDMGYEIISEGADEIANLSKNVDTMRRTMLNHIKREKEAREANTELITSISHDIRTPLTVLMGYIEMMKDRGGLDETMQGYLDATESTAMRLKQLSDDMFKYSLAFGDTEKSVRLEEYDAMTLFDQLLSEHILLLREKGYDIKIDLIGEMEEGCTVRTDAQNLMRIIDNVFSNMTKYADPKRQIKIVTAIDGDIMTVEFNNYIRPDTEGAESNGIGLKTCVRLASLIAKSFEYDKGDDIFTCRLSLKLTPPMLIGEEIEI